MITIALFFVYHTAKKLTSRARNIAIGNITTAGLILDTICGQVALFFMLFK